MLPEDPSLHLENPFLARSICTIFRQDPYLSKLATKLLRDDVLIGHDLVNVRKNGLATKHNVHPNTIRRVQKVFRENGIRFR